MTPDTAAPPRGGLSNTHEGGIELVVAPVRVTRWLAGTVAVLTIASLAAQLLRQVGGRGELFGLRPVIDVGSDISIPTWYSSLALLLCAALLAVIAVTERSARGRYASHWKGLALIFLFLSVDETAGIHERAGYTVTRVFATTGVLYYGWVVLGIVGVAAVGATYVRFVLHLPPRTRRMFLGAAAMFVAGSLGVEMLNSRHDYLYGVENLSATLLVAVEELLEMAGVVLFAHALLDYMAAPGVAVRVRFGTTRRANRPT